MTIGIHGIVEEDFIQYRKPSMVIMMPYCNWKCGSCVCQNEALADNPLIQVTAQEVADRYLANEITSAVVFSGLEPLMSFDDVLAMITEIRCNSDDDIVIYTGHNKDEIPEQLAKLREFGNIYMKFGRYVPGQPSKYDEVLRVTLASPNQYGEKLE